MTERRHYRTTPRRTITLHKAELLRGYESAVKHHGGPTAIEDEYVFFRSHRYCVEDYDRLRASMGESAAWTIGYAVGVEERRNGSDL